MAAELHMLQKHKTKRGIEKTSDFVAGTTALGAELGIARASAWHRVNTGSIMSFRIGNQIVVPRQEVERVRGILKKSGQYNYRERRREQWKEKLGQ